ncbi:MAG: PCMD domain-containing protein [Marinifilaceae bacterium]
MNTINKVLLVGLTTFACLSAIAQKTNESSPSVNGMRMEWIPYGNFNNWQPQIAVESFIIGGQTKLLHDISMGDTIPDGTMYTASGSPWANSNVVAKVKGVVKTSVTVYPEKRDEGRCARLDTKMEACKVLGLINIEVLASGTIFLGEMLEPIRDTKNPQGKLNVGIPFTKRPSALVYDYKTKTGGERIKATGFSRVQKVDGPNLSETCLLLQHRWEDADGNIFAKRVGTGWEQFDKNVDTWQNDHVLPIYYGDIRNEAYFRPFMGLVTGESSYYSKNSKGKMVPVQEVGWADANEEVTHMILRMSSSHGGAYIGAPGSSLWIDNVRLGYND